MGYRFPITAALLATLARPSGLAVAIGATAAVPTPVPAAVPAQPSVADSATARLNAVRVQTPPTIDGRLDDAAWAATPGTATFTQWAPVGGGKPSERTTLRVLYDDHAVYIGFDCVQVGTSIVGRLTRRDEDSESEWVWVHLDSRRDGRTATFFAVSVAGVLADGILHDGAIGSLDWDENWEARAAMTPTGWSAEMRIPLRILRFAPDLPVQSWGMEAGRYIALRQETDDWPYIPREVAAPIPFFGRLEDLRNLKQGERVELRPFALGRARHRDADPLVASQGSDFGASAGLDLKLHITPSLTFDSAVNPDFAQVEADTLTLNLTNYEISYPEKRPLFLEGAAEFVTPLQLFYSRRIGSSPATPTLVSAAAGMPGERFVDVPQAATIYGAGKLIGRLGDAWTVGTLSALASRNDYRVLLSDMVTRENRTVEPLTLFNVLRLRRDLGERAQIGVTGTATSRFEGNGGGTCPTGNTIAPGQRCFRDAYLGGVDAVWRSAGADWVAAAQVVGGAVQNGQPDVQLDGTSIRSGDQGLGAWARVAKDGGSPVLAELAYTGIGRRLTYNDLGFMLRQNLHELKGGFELRTLDPGQMTLERHLRLDLLARRNLDGLDLGTTAELGFTIRLRSFWTIHVAADVAPSHFDDREVGDGAALERATYAGGKAEIASDPSRRIWASTKGEVRFLAGGFGASAVGTLSIHPQPQFEVVFSPQIDYAGGEPRFARYATTAPPGEYLFGRLDARSVGTTMRVSYTFTPRLSLQAYAQLFLSAEHFTDFSTVPMPAGMTMPSGARIRLGDLVHTSSLFDADFEQAALNTNVVLRWEYRLGSTLFVVYSRSQLPGVDLMMGQAAAVRAGDISRVPAIDILLVKLSFWWAA